MKIDFPNGKQLMKTIWCLLVLILAITQSAISQDFLKGRLILNYDQKSAAISKKVKTQLNTIRISKRRNLGFERFELIEFNAAHNIDSLIEVFAKRGITATKDYIIPFANAGKVETNDLYNDMGYWNSANNSFYPAKSNMDSVLAFLPPLYQNNADDPEEKVLFVHTEIPRLTHKDLPPIDLDRSVDFWRGGTPLADSNATPHGSWTAGCGFAKWNNAGIPSGFDGGMTGMTNNRRPIILNIADANAGYSSAAISMLYWCYNYCQTYPDRRIVISYSFGGSWFPEPIGSMIDNQNRILLMHSAGNDNTTGYDLKNKFQLSVMATNPNGQKANFSNYGQFVDIAFQGASMYGLSPSDDFGINQWQGTSASAPCAAGLAVTLWNLMPQKKTNEIKAILKDPNNTTWMVAQPDNSEAKPNLRLWHLLGNLIFPLQQKFSKPVNAKMIPAIDLDTLVNDLISTQINRRFFWLSKDGWREITNGLLQLNEIGSGKRYIKYKWINSKGPNVNGSPTESEVVRMIEVYNTKPIILVNDGFCAGADSAGIKLLNIPDIESLDTIKLFVEGNEISARFNRIDSSVVFPTNSKPSVSLNIQFIRKGSSTEYNETSIEVASSPVPSNLSMSLTYDSIKACTGPIASFSSQSSAEGISYQWMKNGTLMQVGRPSFLDSNLLSGDEIQCIASPFSGCWTNSVISKSIVVRIPDCIDNLNFRSVGELNASEYVNNACDGELVFQRRSSTNVSQNSFVLIPSKKIPAAGTIEFLLTVTGGSTSNGVSSTNATIFSVQNKAFDWTGSGCFVSVTSTGNISFRQYHTVSGFTTLTATATSFRFNQKSVISISYGKSGMKIAVNGVVRASNTLNQMMNSGVGIIGGIVDSLFGGNLWYLFTGSLDKVRISYKENDFTLNSTCNNFIFTGNGNWDNIQNWRGGIKPPLIVPNGTEIHINPTIGGEALMNASIRIENGAKIIINKDGKLRLPSGLLLSQ